MSAFRSSLRLTALLVVTMAAACGSTSSSPSDGGPDLGVASDLGAVDASRDSDAADGGASDSAALSDGGVDAGVDDGRFDAGGDDADVADAGADVGVVDSGGAADAGPAPGGPCAPYSTGTGGVSSTDCSGSTPICDAVTETCVAPRVGVPCGACRTDTDCGTYPSGSSATGFYPPARCVTITQGGSVPASGGVRGVDRACAIPCDPTLFPACTNEFDDYGWRLSCISDADASGTYCLHAISTLSGTGCRETAGARYMGTAP